MPWMEEQSSKKMSRREANKLFNRTTIQRAELADQADGERN